MTTMTLHYLGHEPGRARPVASGVGSSAVMSSWRVAPAYLGRGTTGLSAFGFATETNATVANHTTQPCDTTIKRTARSLGTRST